MARIIFSSNTFDFWAETLPVRFPCLQCTENCCTDYLIFLTDADVQRVHDALPELPLPAYLDISDVHVDDYPEVRVAGRKGRLVLKKDPRTGRCVFLASGVNVCAIHAFSPHICQMYPFQVPFDDYQSLELRQDVRCPEKFLCSKEEMVRLIDMAKRFWRKDLPRYARAVEAWNAASHDEPLEAFFDFLLSE